MKLAQVEPDRANIGLVRALSLAMTVPSTAALEMRAINRIYNNARPGRCSMVEQLGGVLPQHGSLNANGR